MRAAVAALALASLIIVSAGSARADASPSGIVGPESDAPRELREARSDIDATMVQMRATSLRVRDQLRATRKRGTKAQITCVDQALSRSDVALRRAREASDEALVAYGRGDLDTARASRRRLVEIRYSQVLAAKDGASCAPQPVALTNPGVTTVKLEIDPKIAPAPPSP